jgi:hypothetical protein
MPGSGTKGQQTPANEKRKMGPAPLKQRQREKGD